MSRSEDDPEYRKVKPEPIPEFREAKDVDPEDSETIPLLYKYRRCTNIGYLAAFVICVLLLVGFAVFYMYDADTRWFWSAAGRDKCGNFCGFKNGKHNIYKHMRNTTCEPTDMSDYPISLLAFNIHESLNEDECITSAACASRGLIIIRKLCTPDPDKEENTTRKREIEIKQTPARILDSLASSETIAVAMFVTALILSVAMFIGIKKNGAVTLRVLMISEILVGLIIAVLCWTCFIIDLKLKGLTFLAPAIVASVFTLIVIITYFILKKRIPLVLQVYEESSKAIFRSPILLFQPLLTILFLLIVDMLIVCSLVVAVTKYYDDNKSYSALSIIFQIVAFIMAIWMYSFANGAQWMITAGTVAAYFFARNKTELRRPWRSSIIFFIRFHFGTVAAGALVVTMLRLVRSMTKARRNKKLKFISWIFMCCLKPLEEVAEYLTKKAFIMTALHARGIYVSGQRAARLIWSNELDRFAVDQLGSLEMHLASFNFMLFCVGVGIAVAFIGPVPFFPGIPLLIGFFGSGTITFFYVSIMNGSVDTLLMCFCEDRLMNDGSSERPFYMSPNLLIIIQDTLAEATSL